MKWGFIIVSLLLLSGAVSAITPTPTLPDGQTLRIRSEVGESYVQWSWRSDTSQPVPPLTIILDDNQSQTLHNYVGSSYVVDRLKSGGRHNIAIYNGTEWANGSQILLGKATTTTLKPAYEVYFLIAITILIMLLIIVLGNDLTKLVLLSIFNIIICLFGMSIANGRGATPYIFVGVAIITGIILLVQGLPKIREDIDWF